jgi:hypothetical protein
LARCPSIGTYPAIGAEIAVNERFGAFPTVERKPLVRNGDSSANWQGHRSENLGLVLVRTSESRRCYHQTAGSQKAAASHVIWITFRSYSEMG